MPNKACASRARWATSWACSAWSATSRPMATATARRRSRFSHSSGLLIVKVNRGWTNRKSKARNAATEVITAGTVPQRIPTATTASR